MQATSMQTRVATMRNSRFADATDVKFLDVILPHLSFPSMIADSVYLACGSSSIVYTDATYMTLRTAQAVKMGIPIVSEKYVLARLKAGNGKDIDHVPYLMQVASMSRRS